MIDTGTMARPNVNSECTELYKEAKKYLGVTLKLVSKFENSLKDLISTKERQDTLITPASNEGRLKTLHNIEPLLTDMNDTLRQMRHMEQQFLTIAKEEKSCKKTYFFRVKHIMTSLEKAKLSLTFMIQRHISSLLQIVARRNVQVSSVSADWLYVLETIDAFNQVLTNHDLQVEADSTVYTLLHGRRNRGAHLHENFSPSHFVSLRPVTSSKILQTLASERSVFAAAEMSKGILVGIDNKSLQLAAEEVSWLSMPCEDKEHVVNHVHHIHLTSSKNKDGNGNRRKNRNTLTDNNDGESPTSDYHSQNGGGSSTVNHFSIIEDFVASEEHFLNGFFNVLAQVRFIHLFSPALAFCPMKKQFPVT